MSTHAYIPLYVDDFEAATAHLSLEEDGVYNRLLRLCWRTPGCSLPNDHAWIARKIRLSPEDFERVGRSVLEEFFRLQRGRLVQRRLKAEYDDISRKQIARKRAGKKGGDAKAAKTKGNPASIASHLPEDTRAFQTQNHIQSIGSEDKSSGAVAPLVDPDKDAWNNAVALLCGPGNMSPPQARKFFGSLLADNALRARDMLGPTGEALANGTQDPKAYLAKAAKQRGKRRPEAEQKRVGFV